MTSGFFSGEILRGLAARVLLFLSLALLPIGMIAIVQTQEISDQSRTSVELSLVGITEIATTAEQQIFQDAFSAARALSAVVRIRRQNNVECSDFLREYKLASGIYSVVAFMAIDGNMSCSSTGEIANFSENPNFQRAIQDQRPNAFNIPRPELSSIPVTVVYAPLKENGETIGILAISIPFTSFNQAIEPKLKFTPLAVMTFNTKGEILTSERAIKDPSEEMPEFTTLATLRGKQSRVYRSTNQLGQERIYSVVPVVPDTIYAISVWPTDAQFFKTNVSGRLTALLPVFMWIASLVVAFWALNRLAIKHIRQLGRQMRRFALNRTLPSSTLAASVPTELVDMERAFLDMAESIMQDEARVEDTLREKNMLLKEVHHRVKNNLQLISSMMNMQIRQAPTEEERSVLRRLQQRILGLATVHENLDSNNDLARVDASSLLKKSVGMLLNVDATGKENLKVSQHYDPVMLDPDNAAPLTLLVSEAMTNALKYVTPTKGCDGKININLTYTEAEEAQLIIENSASPLPAPPGSGIGAKLITAFARQLQGRFDIVQEKDMYRLTVVFPVSKEAKQVVDY